MLLRQRNRSVFRDSVYPISIINNIISIFEEVY